MLYGGFIMRNHFGVFLTTGISRLWYAALSQEYPVVCFGIYCRDSFKRNYLDSFFEAAKFYQRRFVSFSKPVILEKIMIPYPSNFEKYEIFDAHKIIPEKIAKNILKGSKEQTSQPLFFSRRRLTQDRRSIMNEDKLEQELVKKGVAICCPEQITLEEQIRLLNRHKTIIGTTGSALHNILFNVLDKEQMICLNYKNDIVPTFLLFDMLKSMYTLHIGALDLDSNCSKTVPDARNRILDLDVAFEGLRKFGIL